MSPKLTMNCMFSLSTRDWVLQSLSQVTLGHDFLCTYISLLGNVLPVGQWLIHLCAQHLKQCLSACLGASQVALMGKNPPANAGDAKLKLDPWDGRIPWRGKCQPIPVFLPGELHGQRSLVGYTPRGLRQLDMDMTERLSTHSHTHTHTHTRLFIEWIFEWIIQNQLLLQTYFPRVPQLIDLSKIINWGFSGGSVVKNLPANVGDARSIPGLGRSSGEGNGNPLQYSCLGNPMDRGAWWATVHGVTKRVVYDLMTKQQTQWLTMRFIVLISFYSHWSQGGFPWSATAPM